MQKQVQLAVAGGAGGVMGDNSNTQFAILALWIARRYGIHRVSNLAEFSDSLEVFSIGRRVRPAAQAGPGAGIATVHDSGLERAHAVDVADEVGVPFAAISETTRARLADILDPGLIPTNPLDVWGTGADTRSLFARSLLTLAEDPSVTAVALAVDMIRELDGDLSYPQAVLEAASQTTKPVVVLSNLPSAVDLEYATELRQQGVPVLEGMRTGQPVSIAVDAYPQLKLRGHVDSIQMGSGSRFSAFPAENATGNFVKIVQRVPVKILIDSGLPAGRMLPLGLSVVPTVDERVR